MRKSARCYLRGTSALGLLNTVLGCLFNRVLVLHKRTDSGAITAIVWDRADRWPPDTGKGRRPRLPEAPPPPSIQKGD